MKQACSLVPFGHVRPAQNTLLDLPSWALDWSRPANTGIHERYRSMGVSMFKACGDHQLSLSLANNHTIKLRGKKIDTISQCGRVSFGYDTEEERLRVVGYWGYLCGISSPITRPSPYILGGDKRDALCRTLVNDMILDKEHQYFRRCVDNDIHEIIEWLLWTWSAHIPWGAVKRRDTMPPGLTDHISLITTGRRLVVMQRDMFGMALWETKHGDLVFIFEWGTHPFVLRPAETTATYTLVGECYLHGIMDGEASVDTWQPPPPPSESKWAKVYGKVVGRKAAQIESEEYPAFQDVFLE
jgi:hypothetical protein